MDRKWTGNGQEMDRIPVLSSLIGGAGVSSVISICGYCLTTQKEKRLIEHHAVIANMLD